MLKQIWQSREKKEKEELEKTYENPLKPVIRADELIRVLCSSDFS